MNKFAGNFPEQTFTEDSMLRPMSMANVSELVNDPSADKSNNAYQIWSAYREAAGATPTTDCVEDDENDQTEEDSTPRQKVKLEKRLTKI